MTPDEIQDGIARLKKSQRTATVGEVVALLEPLMNEARDLRRRVAELEATPLDFTGPYETGREYRKNQLCVDGGSLWIALRTTTQRPGDGDGWCLCAKRGRDGKDLR